MTHALLFALTSPLAHVLALALLCLYTLARASSTADRVRADWLLVASLVTLATNLTFRAAAGSLSAVRPYKLDAWAFAADSLLGNPSFALGSVLSAHPALRLVCMAAYDLLPFAMLLALWATITYRPLDTRSTLVTYASSALLLPLLYLAVPICGPAYAFPSFPVLPAGPVPLTSMLLSSAPNAMPSGHFAGALLVLWLVRHWRLPRLAALVFLALTFLATLGLGEHYAVDLIAAIPYTALVLRLGKLEWRFPRARVALPALMTTDGH